MTRVKQNSQLLWVVLGLRIILFLAELGVGLRSHSLSLLAGSGHLLSDLVTLGLTLLAAYLVERQSIKPQAFRYQQLEIWVAMVNGLSLMAIAFLITWETISYPQVSELELNLPALIVAGLSVVINGVNIYLLHDDSHHNLNLRGVFLHGIADAASSLGVMLSALVVYCWHWLWADAVASLFVVSLIVWSALSLFLNSFKLLIEKTSESTDVRLHETQLFKTSFSLFSVILPNRNN